MRLADRTLRIGVAVFLLVGACRPRQPLDEATAAAIAQSVLTNEEMTQAGVLGLSVFEAVQRLRPGFLIDRTAGRRASTRPIQVSVNGGQMGAISALNVIPASTVAEIRYLTFGEASQRFGSRAIGPVILVTLMTR